jgi:hypothetical protein
MKDLDGSMEKSFNNLAKMGIITSMAYIMNKIESIMLKL